jgi:hypothetical protein
MFARCRQLHCLDHSVYAETCTCTSALTSVCAAFLACLPAAPAADDADLAALGGLGGTAGECTCNAVLW